MWYTHREICSLGEDLGEDYMKKEKVKSCRDQYRAGQQRLGRDSNAIDINRGREGDRTCFMYRKWGYIAKNC